MAEAKKKEVAVDDFIEDMENITPQIIDNDNSNNSSSKNAKTEASQIQASQEIIQAIEELRRFGELKKRLQNVEDHYKDKIMNFMQFHQQLKNGVFTLATWKTHSRSSFDTQSFKQELPDLYDAYLKENSIRVFKLY